MEETRIYSEVLLLLAGAVISAPLFMRIGLGTILGYLAAGIVIGPVGRLVTGGDEFLHVSELGIVFLLFLIGLELKPSRLWGLRREIFGLGFAQVLVSGSALAILAHFLAGFSWQAAVIVGFGLALSSTAFSMQTLESQGATNTRYGQTTFAILLFQDLAIVPLLALIPLLAPGAEADNVSGSTRFAIAVLAVVLLLFAGRYLLNPLFRIIANTGAKEAMIAAALLVVLGAATLMQLAGLSMAMGAFVAGVMLAESSYRHELEADIEPFRGVLLGLFFMSVGLSLDLHVVLANWLTILVAVPLLMIVKVITTYLACRIFRARRQDAVRTAMLLPQGGEFAFVLFSSAASAALFSAETASLLVAVITCSMALMPFLAPLSRPFAQETPEEIEEDFEGAGSDVLMIGFSRFGQIASQILLTGGSNVTIIDRSADRVRSATAFGFRIYFGDGTRKDVLEAAGIRKARIVAVCTNKRETTDRIVDLIQSEFPETKLFVRSYDRGHALELRAKDIAYEIRETLESALVFGSKSLEALGMSEDVATAIREDVRRRDQELLALQAIGDWEGSRKRWHTQPVTPKPLVKPQREGTRLDKDASETA